MIFDDFHILALPLQTRGPKIYLTLLNAVNAPPYRNDLTGSAVLFERFPSSTRLALIKSQLQTGTVLGVFRQVPSIEHWQPVSDDFLEPLQ